MTKSPHPKAKHRLTKKQSMLIILGIVTLIFLIALIIAAIFTAINSENGEPESSSYIQTILAIYK